MRKTFIRTLAVTAVLQFAVTRMLAGQVVEEGKAERMWMMYPLNVLINAFAWTLLLSAGGRVMRVFRRVS
jgi:hypothetical protein